MNKLVYRLLKCIIVKTFTPYKSVPLSFAQRACAGFATLGEQNKKHFPPALMLKLQGARGVSLTFSSGDGGVGDGDPDPATQTCITNDGTNRTAFIPLFPASCPLYVQSLSLAFAWADFSS